ncbi:MAG: DNA internalization-related competence protein ComEC/Rec2 [Acidobacteria bacterium]|nr:DNA internalization-related competence protein ComEC/Rec2 [Acidobacteriota bacterium]
MSHPAWLPALSLLVGAIAGAIYPDLGRTAIAVALVLGWIAGTCAFARRLGLVFGVCVALGFSGAAYLLASAAMRQALDPPVRRFFDEIVSRQQGMTEPDTPFWVEGLLLSDAAVSAGGATLRIEAEHIRFEDLSSATAGSIAVTVGGTLGAARLGDWRAGRRVRAPMLLRLPTRYRNFGMADRERWQASRGPALSGYVKSAPLLETFAQGAWHAEAASAVRARVRRAVEATVGRWNAQSSAIVTAILIGDRAGLSAETERRLQEAGTYHVIAISGGNIAIFATILLGTARLARLGVRSAVWLTVSALGAYAYIAGGGASVARATLMAIVCLSARALDHRSSTLNAIACAASIMLCLSPLTIFDAGFALTFGATLAIVIGVPLVTSVVRRLAVRSDTGSRARRGRPGRVRRWAVSSLRAAVTLLAASAAAEVVLLPLGAWLFARITFAGLALNFVAIPLMVLAQCAGLCVVAIHGLPWVRDPIAGACGYAAHFGADGLVASAALVDVAPWVSMRVLPPSAGIVAAYYLAWGIWLWARSGRHGVLMFERLRVVRVCSLGAPVVIGAWIAIGPQSRLANSASGLQATFIDVGQGDSALVRFPGGQAMLVDTGGVVTRSDYDFGERVLAPALWGLKVTRLERLAVTHGDPDHMGAAPAVVRNFDVHEIWEGVPVPRHEPLAMLAEHAAARGIAWRALRVGDGLRIADARLTLWHPPLPDWERQRVRNDDSLVMEIVFGDVSLVLTGDIGREVERQLATRMTRAPLRIVKVPHHGSLTSSSWEFLSAIRPDVAIFSAGRGNRYGHPAPEVVERYRRVGAIVLRTDLDGAIQMDTDGRRVSIRTFMGRQFTLRPRR